MVDVTKYLIARGQEVRDNSSIAMKNDEVLYHQVLHAVPEYILMYYDLMPFQF